MGHRTLLVAAAFAAIGLSAAPASATNILANPDFESGSLSPWFQSRDFSSHGGAGWATETAVVFDGAYSAGVGDNYELRQNFAPVDTSTISQISVWANTIVMAYDFFYSDGTDEEFTFDGMNTWQFYDVTDNLLPGKLLTGISYWGNTSTPAYIDDAVVQVGPVPEPAAWAMLIGGLALLGSQLRRRGLRVVMSA